MMQCSSLGASSEFEREQVYEYLIFLKTSMISPSSIQKYNTKHRIVAALYNPAIRLANDQKVDTGAGS